jgi:peptidoglycan/LPS O-acetylase OafA/YrhL
MGERRGLAGARGALQVIGEARRRCEEWTMDETSADALARRRRARRRFGVISALFGAGLLVCGALLSGGDEALDAVGLACVAYGIGLLVAGVWLALGHNPLDRGRR